MNINHFIFITGYAFLASVGALALTVAAILIVIAWREIMQETYKQVRNTYYFAVYMRLQRRQINKKAKRH